MLFNNMLFILSRNSLICMYIYLEWLFKVRCYIPNQILQRNYPRHITFRAASSIHPRSDLSFQRTSTTRALEVFTEKISGSETGLLLVCVAGLDSGIVDISTNSLFFLPGLLHLPGEVNNSHHRLSQLLFIVLLLYFPSKMYNIELSQKKNCFQWQWYSFSIDLLSLTQLKWRSFQF